MKKSEKPNILFLMTDQMQARALNDKKCITPNFDGLAGRGVSLKNAYAANPVCSPSRASLMTGLLPHNHGVLHVIHLVDSDQSLIREDRPHWAQRLQDGGYLTGYVGKWHVERSEDLKKYGWDRYIPEAHLKSNLIKSRYIKQMQGYPESLLYGVCDTPPEERPVGIHTDAALSMMDEFAAQDKPWCIFVSSNEPHDPFVCGEEAYSMYDAKDMDLPISSDDDLNGKPNLYKKAARVFTDLSDDEKKEAMACYYASITEIDAQYGRLLEKLEELSVKDDTLVILTSDHGEFLGAHGLYQKNISAFEEAYNIPMILAGAGVTGRGSCEARVGIHDLCQTILDASDCPPINTPDSKSFVKLLSAPDIVSDEWKRGYAEYFGGRVLLTQRVVWDKNYKYVFNGFDEDELYDLDKDPYEMVNLIDPDVYSETIKHMSELMWEYVRKTGDHSLEHTHYASLRLAPYGSLIK